MKMILFLIAIFAICVTGCVSVFSASYNYNLAVKNIGSEEIWCSLVASTKGVAHVPGRVSSGNSATFAGPFKLPYADKWTVAWKTANGEKFERTLDLTGKLPKAFEGRLVFTIDAANNLAFVTERFDGK